MLTNLSEIPDGSKVYLRPVGRVSAAFVGKNTSLDYAGTGVRYAGVVVYARPTNGATIAGYFSVELLLAQLEKCSTAVRIQLECQIVGFACRRAPVKIGDGAPLAFTKPLIMGVLNVTPDSFSDGGKYLNTQDAVRRARAMAAAGADIIDIGGESTRPGATPVWEGEEAERIVPVIEAMAGEGVALSVDTRNSYVMQKAYDAGAHIINDVSALTHDPDSIPFVAGSDMPVILMHAQGAPQTMQDDPKYDHILLDVYDYLEGRIEACVGAGITKDRIILDPGIGFGKRVVQDNIALINGISIFHTLGCPILLGASRKRFIGAITGVDEAGDRQIGSVVAAASAVADGVSIVRVHDVAQTVEAVKMIQAFTDASVIDGAH